MPDALENLETNETTTTDVDNSGDGAQGGDGAPPQDDLTAEGTGDGVQKKIDKLTRKRRDAERALQQAQSEAAYYKGLAEGYAPAAETEQSTGIDLLDYETDAEYQTALANKIKSDIEADFQAKEQAKAKAAAQAKALSQIEESRTKYADFDEIIDKPQSVLPFTPHMVETMMASDMYGELLYHLSKNPSEVARIASLPSGTAQASAIGEFKARITDPPKKEITSAPRPVPTVGGGGGNPPARTEQEMLDAGARADLHAKWNKEQGTYVGA